VTLHPAGPAAQPRIDGLTGLPVMVSGGRQTRPNRPAGACPFCPGGLEAPEPYDVRWFPNRWPPLRDGRAEVLLFAPDHGRALWELGVDRMRRVVDLWAARTAALGARPDVAYVLLFENRGGEVGATIDHPHGQAYALAEVPPAPAQELTADHCALCEDPTPATLVTSAGLWKVWCPAASVHPYELRIAPGAHLPSLPAASDDERASLAASMVDAMARLDQLFDAPMPYMLWWHQCPTDGTAWPLAHVHCHIAPWLRAPGTGRYIAAGELGSGIFFNPVAPDDAAAMLRALPGA
jgi:UDPglucose--hexose-1-phosphate uridylyltransferase